MSATANYYGLMPWTLAGGGLKAAIQEFTLTANSSTGFFLGDIVNVGAGVITPIATTPTTTRNGNTPMGIVAGVKYYTSDRYMETNFLPANGYTSFSTYGPIKILVYTMPDLTFRIQANGAVAATDVGKNAPLAFATGSSTTGKSATRLLAASIATTNTLAVRILAITNLPSNAAGDAYTDVICQWVPGVHALDNATGV